MADPELSSKLIRPGLRHKKPGLRALNQVLPSTIRGPRRFQRLASMKSVTAADASGSEPRGLEFAFRSMRFDGAERGLNSISEARDACRLWWDDQSRVQSNLCSESIDPDLACQQDG
jgi:hypothetical protein